MTGLLKVIQLWRASQVSPEERIAALESERNLELEYELATTKRLLHVCEEGIELYQESRFNPERFR